MNKIKFISILFLVFLLTSCGANKKPQLTEHIPPSDTHDQHSKSIDQMDSGQRKIIVAFANQSIGLPYKWGGNTLATGFDCSGLTYSAYQKAGIRLPRTARSQFNVGTYISKTALKMADLVFFDNPYKNKTFHVGIYIGKGMFIHSPGKGRFVSYGSLGNPYFKDNYKGARSYF